MNILYILGNGFDKAQGMATSYSEFYEYLMNNVKGGSDLLNKMKAEIRGSVELWSDMERRLGEFAINTDSPEEYYDFYFELCRLLQEYLGSENEKFSPIENQKTKFQSDFLTINKYLGELDKIRYKDFLRVNGFSSKDIFVVTLNYTNTLEKLLNLKDQNTSKGFDSSTILRNIIHIHGTLGNPIIIGVNSEEQIINESFRNNDDIKDCMIKLQSNQVMKETRHLECEELINKAHVIILYGVSLGETDDHWWKIIGKNLENRKDVIVIQHLYKPGLILPTERQRLGKLERQQQENLMERMRINKSNMTDNDIKKRLFFIVNEQMFLINNLPQ